MSEPKPGDGPETHEDASEVPEPSEIHEEPGDDQQATEDDNSAVAKLRREAAGHRKRLREVEAERDGLVQQRDALAASVLADALRGTGVNSQLFATAGRSIDQFIGADGLDRAAIMAAVKEIRRAFGIANPAISPHTGTGSERAPEGKSWADVLQK